MQEEIWKSVPNYEDYYQVSNLGRVKSLWYNKERILKQTKCSDGYYGVHLYYNKKRVSIRTHKLLAIVFLNHKPNGYSLVVDHIDGDYLNNNIENLQLITQRENTSKKNVSKTSKYIGVCYYKQTLLYLLQDHHILQL